MPKSIFSPRTRVLIENMGVVREALKVFREEVRDDFLTALRHLHGEILSATPNVAWVSERCKVNRKEMALYLCPDKLWEVENDNSVAIMVAADSVVEPAFDNERDDPYVGIYVPDRWAQIDEFNEGLKSCLPKGFNHFRGDRDLAKTVPIWSHVHLSAHIRRGEFDEISFMAEVVSLVKALIRKKPAIDQAIVNARRSLKKGVGKNSVVR